MALRVGTKNSSMRNRAFEIIKKLYAAMGIPRDFSANEFRNMPKAEAVKVRQDTKYALVRFGDPPGWVASLKNGGDPLADYDTAYTNLGKVIALNPAPVLFPSEEPSISLPSRLVAAAAAMPPKTGPGPFAGATDVGSWMPQDTDLERDPILGEEGDYFVEEDDDFAEEGNVWTRLPPVAQIGIVAGGSVAGILLLRSLVRGRG